MIAHAAPDGLPWVDTHCHLDAREFDPDRDAVHERLQAAGVIRVVIPAVDVHNFERVRALAHGLPGGRYALGIHPMCSPQATEADLARLDAELTAHARDPALVAVGEVGIDLFIESLKSAEALAHQEWLFREQLKLARAHRLPVLVHIRRAQDRVLKTLREVPTVRGIAHAFNGSSQQAHMFHDLGFKLGIGGAMTYARALNIRRIATDMPQDALVLETDAPDIAPEWRSKSRNEPAEIPAIGAVLAQLRNLDVDTLAQASWANAREVMPQL